MLKIAWRKSVESEKELFAKTKNANNIFAEVKFAQIKILNRKITCQLVPREVYQNSF